MTSDAHILSYEAFLRIKAWKPVTTAGRKCKSNMIKNYKAWPKLSKGYRDFILGDHNNEAR